MWLPIKDFQCDITNGDLACQATWPNVTPWGTIFLCCPPCPPCPVSMPITIYIMLATNEASLANHWPVFGGIS